MSRRRIHLSLSTEVLKRFKEYAAATGTTESALTEAALTEFLDPARDKKLLDKRLDRLGRAAENVQETLGVLRETLLGLVETYLAHTPEIQRAQQEAAQSSAARRFDGFLKVVERRLMSGGTRGGTVRERSVVPDDDGDFDA